MRAGLFLGDKSIKIVKVVGNKPLVLKVALEQGILEEGVIKNPEKLKIVLAKLVRQMDLSKSEVVLGISEKYIFSKAITVSDHGSNLEEKIEQELESYVPQGAESHIDWQISEKLPDKEVIFVVSVPSSLLDAYIHLCQQVSLKIVGIEPLASAIVRHLPKFLLQDKATKEEKSLKKSDSKSKENKAQPQPAKEILVSTLIVTMEESEVLLTIANEKGHIELTSILPAEIEKHGDELLSEISNMRLFFDRKAQSKIGRILVTGEGATEGLKGQIASHLTLPCEFLQMQYQSLSREDALSFFPIFALCDLHTVYPKDHQQINVLPDEILQAQALEKKQAFQKSLIKITTGVFSLYCLFYLFLFAFLFWNQQTINGEILKYKESRKTNNSGQLRAQVATVNKYIDTLKRIKTRQDPSLSILPFLSEKPPSGIIISQYTINLADNTVSISGQSLDREVLLSFKQVLETEGNFQNIAIPLASLEKKGATTFSLSFQVKPKQQL